MGNQILIWRLAVDLSLVTAILVMAFRWMKASRAQAMLPRTLELEASLRSLISDADAAGSHLNEQLLRREQNLQKLLVDVTEAEGRLSRSISSAEDRSKEIQLALDNARELIAELRESFKEEQDALRRHQRERRSHHQSAAEQRPVSPQYAPASPPMRAPEARRQQFEDTEYFRAPRAEEIAPSARGEKGSRALQYEIERSSTRRDDELQRAPVPAPTSQAPLREAPRKGASYEANEPAGKTNMQKIYAAAEVLLKQGRQLEQVSAQTRLPVEEVRMLSQMIEIEREEQQLKKSRGATTPPAADSRLGVLGNIRRQTTSI